MNRKHRSHSHPCVLAAPALALGLVVAAGCSGNALHQAKKNAQKPYQAGDGSQQSGGDAGGGGDPDTGPKYPPGWFELGDSALAADATTRVTSVPSGAGISQSDTYTDGVALAFDSTGRPVVAYSRSNATGDMSQIFVRHWTGSAWKGLGGSDTGDGISQSSAYAVRPDLAVDTSDNITVVWQDNASGTDQIYAKRWNGSAWQAIQGSATGGGISGASSACYGPKVALDASGNPFVVWEQSTASASDVMLMQDDGVAWREMAGSASSGGLSRSPTYGSTTPSIAVDADGAPVVAWSQDIDGLNHLEIYVLRWGGSQWTTLAGSGSGGLGDSSSAYNDDPVVAIDTTGAPIVAWEHISAAQQNTNEIQVERYTGGNWQSLPGVTGGAGFYHNGTPYYPFDLTVDSSGRPVVAYTDNRTGVDEVYLRMFKGTAWDELSSSATGGGVSNSDASSHGVSLAADSEACISWIEMDASYSQAVLRCHGLP